MDRAGFEQLHLRHAEALEEFGRLERAFGEGSQAGPEALEALERFLAYSRTVLEPLLRLEEREIYPVLGRLLPPDEDAGELFAREHETLRALLDELRRCDAQAHVGRGEGDLEAVLRDFGLLLREHIRKEDGVVNPLVQRLSAGGAA